MDYRAMTVNERLFASGNLTIFDEAVKTKNKEKVVQILKEVLLDDDDIRELLKHLGLL